MSKTISTAAIVALLTTSVVHAQRVTFQNGVTLLSGGGTYQGTLDTEFASLQLLDHKAEDQSITVDGFDNGNVAQAAIRFENLLSSDGGLLPDEISTVVSDGSVPIRRAFLTLWKDSPSRPGGAPPNIDFHRVIGPDKYSTQIWQEDDTWNQLVLNLIPSPDGRPQEYPFDGEVTPDGYRGDGIEIEVLPDFQDPVDPRPGDPLGYYIAGNDSQDLLNFIQDDIVSDGGVLGIDNAFDAFKRSFFNYDVTDTVVDWVRNGAFNGGWSITNDTTDGWDFATSEAENSRGQGFLNSNQIIEGLTLPEGLDRDTWDSENLIPVEGYAGLAYGRPIEVTVEDENGDPVLDPETMEPLTELKATVTINGLYARPQLTVVYGENAADLNFNGVSDPEDLEIFLENMGVQRVIDPTDFNDLAARADLDFDGDVDPSDWLLFKRDYLKFLPESGALAGSFSGGLSGLSLAANTTPEPTALTLMLCGLGGAFVRRRS